MLVGLLELKKSFFLVLGCTSIVQSCRLAVLCFLTRQVEECVEDVEAVGVSTLNEFVGVHLSDIRSVQSEYRYIHT